MTPDVHTQPAADEPPPPPRHYPGWLGVVITAVYLALSLGWVVLVTVLVLIALLAGGGSFEALEGGQLPAWALATVTALQFLGWLGLAVALAMVTKRPMQEAFALRRPMALAALAGVLGGLTVGLFPGKVAEELRRIIPESLDFGNMEAITSALTEGPFLARAVMVLSVCVLAPLVEEAMFRGFIWDALEKAFPAWFVWLATSTLFAVYHVDPVHATGVIFIGLFLGWLRWISGSVWPCVLGHAANNTLAAVLTIGYADQISDAEAPWWAAFTALALTLAFAGMAAVRRGRAAEPSEA